VSQALRFPWDVEPAPATPAPEPDAPIARPKPRGRRPGGLTRAAGQGSPAAPGWLYHHLTISGPAAHRETFAAAARGAGVVPWRLDGGEIEETVFALAVSQPARARTLTVEGCRILARQFRDRAEARQAQAAALVGRSLACPFDLHTLLPVPDAILQLGPSHPSALAWLTENWGVSDRLRQVVERAKPTTGRASTRGRGRLANGHAVTGYGFFTAGDTPQAAIERLAAQWPGLRFLLVPRPAD
jgi:hypothetical protein